MSINFEIVLVIIGSFCGLALTVIGFLLKSLLVSINRAELSILRVTVSHEAMIKNVDTNTVGIIGNNKELQKTRERLHSLEGGQLSMLELVKMNDREIKNILEKVIK